MKQFTEAAVLRAIQTRSQKLERRRQKLKKEAKRKGCTDPHLTEIESELTEIDGELEDLKALKQQECGTGEPKHPSSRPTARELGFATDAPSVNEILEAAIIQQGLCLKRGLKRDHLIFAKLAKLNPKRWGRSRKA
jgi:hypothetical protein